MAIEVFMYCDFFCFLLFSVIVEYRILILYIMILFASCFGDVIYIEKQDKKWANTNK